MVCEKLSWMAGWTDGWMGGGMDGQMDELKKCTIDLITKLNILHGYINW